MYGCPYTDKYLLIGLLSHNMWNANDVRIDQEENQCPLRCHYLHLVLLRCRGRVKIVISTAFLKSGLAFNLV